LFSIRKLTLFIVFVLLSAQAWSADKIGVTYSSTYSNVFAYPSQIDETISQLPIGAPGNSDSVVVYRVKPGIYYTYLRAKPSRYYTFPFINIKKYFEVTFRKEKIPEMVEMAASTAILIAYDQKITDEAREFADKINLSHREHQSPVVRGSVKYNGQVIKLPLNFPSDANTAMYFLGDGITHLSVSGGIWLYGTIEHDWRAQQTGAQLVEAIGTTGTVIQILKHSTGRECASVATAPGGKWRFFPNLTDYGKHVPKYDAYPTGHLATAMATVTIIADNYPEKTWIRPFGYTLMTLCGYAMVNNGVHWASDYPLGISIGYTMAKLSEARGKTVIVNDDNADLHLKHSFWKGIKPGITWNGNALGYGLTIPLD